MEYLKNQSYEVLIPVKVRIEWKKEQKMEQRKIFKKIAKKIMYAPDSDDVYSIMQNIIEELVTNRMGDDELQLSIHCIQQELEKMIYNAQDYIELNNIKRGMEFIESKALETPIYRYEFN